MALLFCFRGFQLHFCPNSRQIPQIFRKTTRFAVELNQLDFIIVQVRLLLHKFVPHWHMLLLFCCFRMAVVLNVEIFKCKVSHGHSHDGGGHGHSHGGGQGHSHNVPLSSRNKRRDDQHQLTLNTDDDGLCGKYFFSFIHLICLIRVLDVFAVLAFHFMSPQKRKSWSEFLGLSSVT